MLGLFRQEIRQALTAWPGHPAVQRWRPDSARGVRLGGPGALPHQHGRHRRPRGCHAGRAGRSRGSHDST
eukprot:11662839-Alexandrium_andersonii.AAC.1